MNVSSWRHSTLSSARHRQYGFAALAGGLLNLVIAFTGTLANSYQGTTAFWMTMFVQALATGLMLGGLYGLHRRYGDQYGRIGLALAALFGFGLAWLTAAMVLQGFSEALALDFSAPEQSWFFVNLVSMLLASLYGMVIWRNGILGVGGVTMAGTVFVAIGIIVALDALVGDIGLAFWVPLGLAWTVVGYEMLRNGDTGLRLNRH